MAWIGWGWRGKAWQQRQERGKKMMYCIERGRHCPYVDGDAGECGIGECQFDVQEDCRPPDDWNDTIDMVGFVDGFFRPIGG
jgi:hypothetical protein